jgi:hypothetical protein
MSVAAVGVLRVVATVMLTLAAPFLAIVGLAALGLMCLYLYFQIVPAKSAAVFLPEIDTTVKLQFYYTWDDESGRFISIKNHNGTVRSSIDGWDWAHNARTSIYVTQEGNIAILGPAENDYVADGKTLRLRNLLRAGKSSQTWKYMGAFDSGSYDSLHFFSSSDQKECIPMLMEYELNPALSRAEHRRQSCGHDQTEMLR